MEVIMPF